MGKVSATSVFSIVPAPYSPDVPQETEESAEERRLAEMEAESIFLSGSGSTPCVISYTRKFPSKVPDLESIRVYQRGEARVRESKTFRVAKYTNFGNDGPSGYQYVSNVGRPKYWFENTNPWRGGNTERTIVVSYEIDPYSFGLNEAGTELWLKNTSIPPIVLVSGGTYKSTSLEIGRSYELRDITPPITAGGKVEVYRKVNQYLVWESDDKDRAGGNYLEEQASKIVSRQTWYFMDAVHSIRIGLAGYTYAAEEFQVVPPRDNYEDMGTRDYGIDPTVNGAVLWGI